MHPCVDEFMCVVLTVMHLHIYGSVHRRTVLYVPTFIILVICLVVCVLVRSLAHCICLRGRACVLHVFARCCVFVCVRRSGHTRIVKISAEAAETRALAPIVFRLFCDYDNGREEVG